MTGIAHERTGDRLDDAALDRLFRSARTHRAWLDRAVPESLLRELYALMSLGPTSANCQPVRLVFIRSDEARARLLPLLSPGNRWQTETAPVTAVVGHDLAFYEQLPRLYPHQPGAREWFTGSAQAAREAALRNATLQGGYLIMAARALGLDCGPMGGFDAQAVAREFFPQGGIEAGFLCNLGYGSGENMHPRLPRLAFEDACVIV